MDRMIDFFVDTNILIYAIKQKYTLKASDAIIAATAKSFNLPLVTADKDFKKIKDADIVILDLNK